MELISPPTERLPVDVAAVTPDPGPWYWKWLRRGPDGSGAERRECGTRVWPEFRSWLVDTECGWFVLSLEWGGYGLLQVALNCRIVMVTRVTIWSWMFPTR